jgi:osmotically-inducible protein OsmY
MSSDSDLQARVLAEIKWCPNILSAQIGVAVHDGVVTLSGQVPHYAIKLAAENAAKKVFGVFGVANDIKVEIQDSNIRSDADIALAAVNALRWDVEVPPDLITVSIRDGALLLEGSVDFQFQKDAAERCTRFLQGVTAHTNLITIKPVSKWNKVKDAVAAVFERN